MSIEEKFRVSMNVRRNTAPYTQKDVFLAHGVRNIISSITYSSGPIGMYGLFFGAYWICENKIWKIFTEKIKRFLGWGAVFRHRLRNSKRKPSFIFHFASITCDYPTRFFFNTRYRHSIYRISMSFSFILFNLLIFSDT